MADPEREQELLANFEALTDGEKFVKDDERLADVKRAMGFHLISSTIKQACIYDVHFVHLLQGL